MRRLIDQYGNNDLQQREFGAFMVTNTTGGVDSGPIQPGEILEDPNVRGSVQLDHTLVDWTRIIGSFHTHPGGSVNRVPSVEDRDQLNWIRSTIQLANSYGHPYRNPNLARFYVAFRNPVGPGQTPTWTVVAYDHNTIEAAINGDETAGREVNPDAQTCPL